MVTYTVHEREDESGDISDRAEEIIFVKEGYAWAALLIPILWLVYHRMWLVLAGFVALIVAVQAVISTSELGEEVTGWAMMLVNLFFALLANDLRRWNLESRGYRLIEPVSGQNLAQCEERFFTQWLAAQAGQGSGGGDAPRHAKRLKKTSPKRASPSKVSSGADDVIGLFPEPGK